MRFFQKEIQKLGNKGLTMIELICAVAIVTLLGTAVSSIFIVGANSYRRSGSETEVQKEAQLVANQITDYIIDSAKDVNVTGGVLKFTLSDLSTGSISLNGTDLMYSDGAGSYLLAEGVQSFAPSISDGNVQLKMTLKNGDRDYESVFNVSPRNLESKDNAIASKVKISSTIKRWVLEPNEELDFSGKITATSGSYVLSIENSKSSSYATKCNSDETAIVGTKLKIGADEKVSCVRVVATSTTDTTVKTYINVYVRRVNGVSVVAELKAGFLDCKMNSLYKLNSAFTGSSLSKVKGAPYDDPTGYFNTRNVEYKIEASGAYNKAEIVTDVSNTNIKYVKLKADLLPGDVVTVLAIPLHTRGKDSAGVDTNRTGMVYDGTLVGKCTIKLEDPNPIVNPVNDGWLRWTNQKVADIDGTAMNVLASKYGGTQNTYQTLVRYKIHGQPETAWSAWMLDYNGDGHSSNTINLRGSYTSALEYNKDYDVQIYLRATRKEADGSYTEVWPCEEEMGFATRGVPKDNYLISSTMKKVAVLCNSAYGPLSLAAKNSESNPLVVEQSSTQIILLEPMADYLEGIDKNSSITSKLQFDIRKGTVQPDGSVVYDGDVVSVNSDKLRYTPTVPGKYQIKLSAIGMEPHYFNADGSLSTGTTTVDYLLYDNANGNGVFYFEVVAPSVSFTGTIGDKSITNGHGISETDAATVASLKQNDQISMTVVKPANTFQNVKWKATLERQKDDKSGWDTCNASQSDSMDSFYVQLNQAYGDGLYRVLVKGIGNGNAVEYAYDLSSGDGVFYFKVDSSSTENNTEPSEETTLPSVEETEEESTETESEQPEETPAPVSADASYDLCPQADWGGYVRVYLPESMYAHIDQYNSGAHYNVEIVFSTTVKCKISDVEITNSIQTWNQCWITKGGHIDLYYDKVNGVDASVVKCTVKK